MKKFLTMMGLPVTEQLGSQMWHFAALFHIARRSGHRVVFFEEHCNTGKGLRLDRHLGVPQRGARQEDDRAGAHA